MALNDLSIASRIKLKEIDGVAEKLRINPNDLEHFGKYKAKVPLDYINRQQVSKNSMVLVSAISPTPAGEGKTTVSIGLAQALNQMGHLTTVVLREPSLGPVFGMKGGATGGGYSQVVPMEDINLHFTGDFAAIEKAHNLLAALIDNDVYSRKSGLDPRTIAWKRVMDMNDRSLRNIVIGLGGKGHGVPRESGFDITAASEIMAILCLSENLADLKRRLGNILVGFTYEGSPIYARDIHAEGAMTVLLKDAIKPNLVQTLEGTPALIHGGPFANIAQGTNSLIATLLSMSTSPITVTEAGFGFDLGAEKFFDIKCATGHISPQAVVLVATVRALKYHGGRSLKELEQPDQEALQRGFSNLEKHLENIRLFHPHAVVAINRFPTDQDNEVKAIQAHAEKLGVECYVVEAWQKGGAGCLALGKHIAGLCEKPSVSFTPLYDWAEPVQKKIEKVARKIYGAMAVDYTAQAKRDLKVIEKIDAGNLPVCIAKTQKSLSDNPKLLGRPKDFVVTVREIQIAKGAGFVIPITGDILRMPGLPAQPAASAMDIEPEGKIKGMF